jgi:hypothetical protein
LNRSVKSGPTFADLISHEDAEGRLLERAARCVGDWGDAG